VVVQTKVKAASRRRLFPEQPHAEPARGKRAEQDHGGLEHGVKCESTARRRKRRIVLTKDCGRWRCVLDEMAAGAEEAAKCGYSPSKSIPVSAANDLASGDRPGADLRTGHRCSGVVSIGRPPLSLRITVVALASGGEVPRTAQGGLTRASCPHRSCRANVPSSIRTA